MSIAKELWGGSEGGVGLQWKRKGVKLRGSCRMKALEKACFHILQFMGNALPRLVVKGLKCDSLSLSVCVRVCVRACMHCMYSTCLHACFFNVHCTPECMA